MLGLGDQVGGDELGLGRVVGQHDDLARAGDAVDGDLAEDVLLGQGDEQVARPDDHVHRRHALDAVGQRRHRLGAADAVDLGRRPVRGRRPAGRGCTPPVGVGGMTTAISGTPAAWAGQTVISSVDGYAAAPPGTRCRRAASAGSAAATRALATFNIASL